MKVIVATWLNNFNEVYFTELFDSDMFESEILDHYEDLKSMYNHTTNDRTNDTLIFSDGSRVILTYQHVNNSVFDNTTQETRPNTLLRLV